MSRGCGGKHSAGDNDVLFGLRPHPISCFFSPSLAAAIETELRSYDHTDLQLVGALRTSSYEPGEATPARTMVNLCLLAQRSNNTPMDYAVGEELSYASEDDTRPSASTRLHLDHSRSPLPSPASPDAVRCAFPTVDVWDDSGCVGIPYDIPTMVVRRLGC